MPNQNLFGKKYVFMNPKNKKQIVIIGAGFAGLKLARTLNNHKNFIITLIDKNNFHQFQPLLYQVAMANLDASNVSFPLRNIFRKSKNVSIRIGNVTQIDKAKNMVETSCGNFIYDYLVLATGAISNFFGNASIEANCLPMKSTWEALQIRNMLLMHFEDAISSSLLNVEKMLSVIIVGGGPTGVELSGALAEMKRDTLPDEYPELDFSKMEVLLLEGSGKLLASMSEISSAKAKAYLEEMGVTVMLNTLVKSYDGKHVTLADGRVLESYLVIWAAGVKGNSPDGLDANLFTKSGQLKTDGFNKVLESDNVYALGDIAFVESTEHPKGFPQLASVAIDQAANLASNFKRMAANEAIKPYKYVNKGSMATVGRNKAVVDLAKPALSFQGFFAWFIWMALHLFLLIGFKNKLVVFINWIYKYFTHNQSLSLLFEQIAVKDRMKEITNPNPKTP